MSKSETDRVMHVAYEDFEHELSLAEITLLRAILSSALVDLEREGMEGRKAKEYLLNEEEDYLFSFHSICSYLDLNPGWVLRCVGLGQESARRAHLKERL